MTKARRDGNSEGSVSGHFSKDHQGMARALTAENSAREEGAAYSDPAAAYRDETGFRNTSAFRLGMVC